MKCLVGLFEPTGEICYDGQNFSEMNEHRGSVRIGMLFQGSALFDSMTVNKM